MNQPPFSSVDEYTEALANALKGKVTEKQLALVQAHIAARSHTASFEQLARAVGYKSYRAVNAQYGRFASRVAQGLGLSRKPAEGFWAYVLVKWAKGRSPEGHTLFVVRPEVVAAWRRLGVTDA